MYALRFNNSCSDNAVISPKEFSNIGDVKKYSPLPQYPSIERDLAIEIDWQIKWNEILELVQGDRSGLIANIKFLSEYDLGDKKSVAFRIIYQTDRTLKDKEVEVVEKKIIKKLDKNFGAKLRQWNILIKDNGFSFYYVPGFLKIHFP